MHRQILIGLTTYVLTASFLSVSYVKAAHLPLTEIPGSAASKQAAIAQENADRAALTALIAKKQAAWAAQKSTSPPPAEVERDLAEVKARKTVHGLVLTVGNVLFAPGQSEPTAATIRKLSPIVRLLKDQPQKTIRIEGYADRSGLAPSNLTLSRRRVDAVRDILIARGISPRRIIARG